LADKEMVWRVCMFKGLVIVICSWWSVLFVLRSPSGEFVKRCSHCARHRSTALNALTHDVVRHRVRHRTTSSDVVLSVNTALEMMDVCALS